MSLADLRDRIADLWGRLDNRQKALAGGLGVLFLLMVTLSLTMTRNAGYAVAYTGLSPGDAAAIVEQLKEQQVPYQVSAGESIIRVPADKVHEVRLSMASAGLPSGGTVGFEIFDSTKLGITDFAEKLNFRRAMEGELARTIASLDAVEQARVHIVIPQPTIYSDLQQPATASVLLKMGPGRRLSENQIIGITHLIATSVEGLQPEHITIVNTEGNVLNDGLASEGGRINDDCFKAQQAYERAIEAKVLAMLEMVLGPQRAVVSVHADLDWSQTETSRETYEPPAEATPPVRSSRELRESYDGTPPTTEGIPGTQSNLPSVPTYPGITSGQSGTEQASSSEGEYARSDLTYNYELSKIVSHTIEAPGKVKRLSVSVLLDEISDEQQLERIRQAVVAAAGIDTQRGDNVTVESVVFDRSYYEEQETAMAKAARQEQYMVGARWGAIIVAVIVTLLLLRNLVLRFMRPAQPVPAGVAAVMSTVEGLEGAALTAQLPAGDTVALSPEQQETAKGIRRHHQVVNLARTEPEMLAQVIQLWLNEPESRRNQ